MIRGANRLVGGYYPKTNQPLLFRNVNAARAGAELLGLKDVAFAFRLLYDADQDILTMPLNLARRIKVKS